MDLSAALRQYFFNKSAACSPATEHRQIDIFEMKNIADSVELKLNFYCKLVRLRIIQLDGSRYFENDTEVETWPL